MLSTERIYLNDPFCFEFTATVTGTWDLGKDRVAVTLDRTCFYPTGGGQDHDTGLLGAAHVVDVFDEDRGDVIHVVDGTVQSRSVVGKIDVTRRLAFMQHHSAQHLVSAILDQRLGLETVSSHIGIDSPTTIDVPTTVFDPADVRRVEDAANSIVFEDRPIQSYTIRDDQLATLPFRRPPKVTGSIRVVEIEGVDYTACGGTHCTRTGMIGTIKLVRVERRGDKTRIHVVAGKKALEYFQSYHSIITNVARQLDTNPESIPEVIERQTEALQQAEKGLEELWAEKAAWEVRELVAGAHAVGSIRLVTAIFRDRTPIQGRSLGALLQSEAGVVAVLAAHDGKRLTLTVSCGADTGIKANELIRQVLSEFGGRGGGDARLAQGGGTASEHQLDGMFAQVPDHIRKLKGERG